MSNNQRYSYAYPHPAVTTDVVLFTIHKRQLQLLFIQRANEPFSGQWALPGGFLEIDETLEHCAKRELYEETGLSDLYLEQLYTFGQPNRDPRERVISIAYYALAPFKSLQPREGSDASRVAWFDFQALPRLAFDHASIVALAHQRLTSKLNYSTIAFQFLPPEFTLSELQSVYEVVGGNKLDKRNFRKSILEKDLVTETEQSYRKGSHRPARLYRATRPGRVQIIK